MWQATKEFMEEWDPAKDSPRTVNVATGSPERLPIKAHIVGCPAHDEGDEMALEMLRQGILLDPDGRFEILPSTMLASEMLDLISRQPPDAVCISSLGIQGGSQTGICASAYARVSPSYRFLWGDGDTSATKTK